MTTPLYCEQAMLKEYLGITAAINEWQLDQAIKAASRAIDNYCQRRFWLDPEPVAQTFKPKGLTELEIDDDIGSTSGLVIATDASGDGTFETTWAPGDYQLLPVNAPNAWPEPKPWTGIRAVGSKVFPWLVNTWLTRLDRVQITAAWGWPAVPDAVVSACLIKASRLYHRKDSPQGIAGYGDFGPVRLSRLEDGDIMSLLDAYRKIPVLVG